MKMTFRWYGKNDPVPLSYIRQIPNMSGIVSAVYDTPPGEVWPIEQIEEVKRAAEEHGLGFEVVESVPVHEEIKLGGKDAPRLIENYCENVRRLGAAGVKVICYNFMPVFDWVRTTLKNPLPDGSNALAYDSREIEALDPVTKPLSLPGWDESYTQTECSALIRRWHEAGEETLWKSFETFLRAVIPVAEESGIRMAIHPDDPPWGLFGLPRIIKDADSIRRMREIMPSPANGLTLCTGSLGANPENDVVALAREFAPYIPFAHLRNVAYTEHGFTETAHPCGALDLYGVVKALVQNGFDGYVRPDHGRMIFGEEGRPGYGLFDRALGAAYLNGLFEAAQKEEASHE